MNFIHYDILFNKNWFLYLKFKYSSRFNFLYPFFREEYENVVFLYVSDDMEWGRKNLKNKHGDLVKGSSINDVTLLRKYDT